MRTAFINELISQAERRDNVFLLVGDLGYSVVEAFADRFPDRFLNVGIAEQNMTGIAAGLASEGYHVFTYSISNFPTLRCLEQIRNDVCYHNLSVTIVAVGAGLAYGNLGYSHHGVQDIAALAAMPNLTLLSPADPGESRAALQHLLDRPGPSYLRLGKAGEAELHDEPFHALIPVRRSPGAPLAIVATGSILGEAIAAADRLIGEFGITTDVFSCPILKPLAREALESLTKYGSLLTVEEHSEIGGLGDTIRRLLPRPIPVISLGVRESCVDEVGSQSFLRARSGIDAGSIETAARELATACAS